jgi:hypothetical protein
MYKIEGGAMAHFAPPLDPPLLRGARKVKTYW